jgi:hypothetical protein
MAHQQIISRRSVLAVADGATASAIAAPTVPARKLLSRGLSTMCPRRAPSTMQKTVDMSAVHKLIKDGFFEKVFGPDIENEQDRKLKSTLA